ncbi:DUF602-domain-containing protein [Aulographum hederae CBS 113979]|uniref:DUF602-domain-containing protein n=1 Tax=Aulographum hederae CBS 113979 TaxID=1176131 RepID=A0A6G1GNH9_9PEZI|nr:DUF602-domain-containing protein [Aulographum hederae CBS 113979]
MGNDGGSIPTRRELVKEAARDPTVSELKAARLEQQEYAWTTDPISEKPLRRPVVSDSAGRLYRKESVVEYLLAVAGGDEGVQVAGKSREEVERILGGRVKSLKDVVEVLFTPASTPEVPGQTPATAKIDITHGNELYICPITNKPLGPAAKAVYLVPCGHAFAGAAIKEVQREEKRCLVCSEAYAENDVVGILPVDEVEIARLEVRVRMLREKGLSHGLKKVKGEKREKKNKKHASVEGTNGATMPSTVENEDKAPQLTSSTKLEPLSRPSSTKPPSTSTTTTSSSGINNPSTASLTAKVLAEQDARNKKRKLAQNDNIESLYASGPNKKATTDAGATGRNTDFMTRGYSIPVKGKR